MSLKVRKRGKVYHYTGTIAGRRLRGTTGTASKEIAEQIANRAEAREWKRDLNGPEAVLRFSDAAAAYKKSGKSARYMNIVLDYWKEALIKDIKSGTVQQAAIDVYPSASAATRNRQFITPTQAIINHCADLGQCAPIRIRRFKVEKTEKTPVTWAWVQKFAAHSKPHLGALAMFLFLTGARISEALAVRWDDIDFKSRTVLIRQTKSGVVEERRAHLPPALLVALANLPRNKPPFIYTSRRSGWDTWKKACERAGIPYLSYHAGRHGFATGLLHDGVDAVSVAKRGGWKSVRHVFETYGHASDDITVTDRLTGTSAAQEEAEMQEVPVKRA
jgi:integrase